MIADREEERPAESLQAVSRGPSGSEAQTGMDERRFPGVSR